MDYSTIEKHFSSNVLLKTFTELSYDKESDSSLIISDNKSYDYDSINENIKTSDTVIFKSGKITFVEFKKGKKREDGKKSKTKKIKEPDIRLKSTESIISFIDYILKKNISETICFPCNLFQFYLVYDRTKSDPSQVIHFGNLERKLQKQYSKFYSKFSILPQDRFKKIFKL